MSFSPGTTVAGLVQTMTWPTALASISFSTLVKVKENERWSVSLFFHEKCVLYKKNLESPIVRGNKTDNRPNPNSQPDEFLLLSAECLKTALNADILLQNRRILKKDYKRIFIKRSISHKVS